MKHNFGSDIQFDEARTGKHRGVKYQWIASAHCDSPETIFINENSGWFKLGDKRMLRTLRHVMSHEPIHNIINHEMLGVLIFEGYDKLRLKFNKQIMKECPKTFREWNTF